ncbi:hypothetical protein [Streptomyces sp. NPDC088246]|uniref:hypothetical protein n=1 Tax=Streptomyces sp. NPDC088246 TaxID=3365842 RepID=UPI0037F5A678
MADDQQEVAAHLGISVGAARSWKSRGSLPAPDDDSVPDRPRWKPATPGLEAGRPRIPQRPARILPAGDHSVGLTGARTRP